MEDKDLIQIALGITPTWFVKDINLDTSKKRMDIYLDFTTGTKFACSICKKLCNIHDTKVDCSPSSNLTNIKRNRTRS